MRSSNRTHVFIPYPLGNDVRPIPYQYANLIQRFDPSKFEVTCFIEPSNRTINLPKNTRGVPVPHSRPLLKRSTMIRESMRQFDILHTGGGPKLRYYLAKIARLRSPRYSHVHTLHIDVNPGSERNLYKQRLIDMADVTVAVSEHTAETANSIFGTRPTVIYNGIDTSLFTPDRLPPETLFKKLPNSPMFLFVGKLEERKRPMDVLTVAKLIPDANFLIRGEGPLAGHLAQRATNMSNVHILDQLSKETLSQLYAAVDGFLFPSIREGCPTVVLESMASGTPVVGYRATSMPELVTDGETGYLTKPGSIDGLVAGVKHLCDSVQAEKLGAAARDYVTEHHAFDIIAQQYDDLYEDLSREVE